MADRHARHPRAVRIPDGLEAWFVAYAAAKDDRTVNGAIVAAMEDFRARHAGATTASGPTDGATTRAARRPPKRATPAAAQERTEEKCPHPKARIIKGLCRACGTYVG